MSPIRPTVTVVLENGVRSSDWPPDRDPLALGREDCLATGGRWVHLRMCQTCGKIGCCDSSPNQHASKHARGEGHPILRSVERGEDWSWCVIDEEMFGVTR
jgi:ubiquitin-hydrolase Zn-finger-containing protein